MLLSDKSFTGKLHIMKTENQALLREDPDWLQCFCSFYEMYLCRKKQQIKSMAFGKTFCAPWVTGTS